MKYKYYENIGHILYFDVTEGMDPFNYVVFKMETFVTIQRYEEYLLTQNIKCFASYGNLGLIFATKDDAFTARLLINDNC